MGVLRIQLSLVLFGITCTRTHTHTYIHTQVDQMLRGAPVDNSGNFDYAAFTRILKHGTKDE